MQPETSGYLQFLVGVIDYIPLIKPNLKGVLDMKTVIVGGVAGGASAAARLRRLDEQAEIVLFERGQYISFANCGLPYHIGGAIPEEDDLTLQTPESFRSRFLVDVRIGSEVTAIDRENRTVTVCQRATGDCYIEQYDRLILSPGAAPVLPPISGVENARVFTLRNIPDTLRIKSFLAAAKPRRALVVGGGYIGVEMAENLTEAGLQVTVVELSDHLIGPLDFDMACEVHRHMRQNGVELLLKTAVQAIEETENGLNVRLTEGTLETDFVILAVGVQPDSTLAKAAKLMVNERGAIVVDRHMRTSDPAIYAVGDAVETTDFVTGLKTSIPLAGPANKQGRIAADNIAGIPSVYRATQGSGILKAFALTIATTGINEQTARKQGINYEKVYTLSSSHASYYPGAQPIAIKAIFERETGKLLGAQLIGRDGVDKRADVLATAIRAGMTAAELTELELCYAPPYGSAKDPVNFVGYVMENVRTGLVRQCFPEDVPQLPRDGSVTLLDVRTARERAAGCIEGFRHIPLDELRKQMSSLDPAKPVYVHCHSGLRSYIACRILSGHGFNCYNLAGGWRLYDMIQEGGKSRV